MEISLQKQVCNGAYDHYNYMETRLKVRSLYSEQVETGLCAACHAFTLHVHAWRKFKRFCVLVDIILSLFLPLGAIHLHVKSA